VINAACDSFNQTVIVNRLFERALCSTKEDFRTLKTLAREKVKTSVIARKLKRTLGATYQKAKGLRVTLGEVDGRESDMPHEKASPLLDAPTTRALEGRANMTPAVTHAFSRLAGR
jgi:hypothetical protein